MLRLDKIQLNSFRIIFQSNPERQQTSKQVKWMTIFRIHNALKDKHGFIVSTPFVCNRNPRIKSPKI